MSDMERELVGFSRRDAAGGIRLVTAAGIGQRQSVADSGRSAAKAVDTGGRVVGGGSARWEAAVSSHSFDAGCGRDEGEESRRGWTLGGRGRPAEAQMAARAAAWAAILENPSVARTGLGIIFLFLEKTFGSLSSRNQPAVAFICNFVRMTCPLVENDSVLKCKAAGSTSGHAFARMPIRALASSKPTAEVTPFVSF
jgi:hypothetical protein